MWNPTDRDLPHWGTTDRMIIHRGGSQHVLIQASDLQSLAALHVRHWSRMVQVLPASHGWKAWWKEAMGWKSGDKTKQQWEYDGDKTNINQQYEIWVSLKLGVCAQFFGPVFKFGKLMTNQMIPGGSHRTLLVLYEKNHHELVFPSASLGKSNIQMWKTPWFPIYEWWIFHIYVIWEYMGKSTIHIWETMGNNYITLLEGKYPLVISHSYGKFLALFILWLEP